MIEKKSLDWKFIISDYPLWLRNPKPSCYRPFARFAGTDYRGRS